MNKPKFVWPQLLLHPNIPKPLHGMNPRSILGQQWWDIQRTAAYAVNDQCCWCCGVHKSDALYHKWLEAHECYEIDYQAGTAEMRLLVALCNLCHNGIHTGRLNMELRAGNVTREYYDTVLDNRTRLLSQRNSIPWPAELEFLQRTLASLAGLQKGAFEGAEWKQWKLILDGKSYPTRFGSYEDWAQSY